MKPLFTIGKNRRKQKTIPDLTKLSGIVFFRQFHCLRVMEYSNTFVFEKPYLHQLSIIIKNNQSVPVIYDVLAEN